jgi:DNA-binding response OmpR family regulator
MRFETTVHYGGEVFTKSGFRLTKTQTEILKVLMANSGKVLFKNEIVKAVYGETYPVDEYSMRLISAHLSPIRYFLENVASDMEVLSVQGRRGNTQGLILVENKD